MAIFTANLHVWSLGSAGTGFVKTVAGRRAKVAARKNLTETIVMIKSRIEEY